MSLLERVDGRDAPSMTQMNSSLSPASPPQIQSNWTATGVENHLLAMLAPEDAAWLAPRLEPVTLASNQELEKPGTVIRHAYFVERGVCSVMAGAGRGRQIEVNMIGPDGMVGTALVQGDSRTPYRCFVHSSGTALRIGAEELASALVARPGMRELLNRYVRALGIQAGWTAHAYGCFGTSELLARRLLMLCDRMQDQTLNVTHEFMSVMLGVARTRVTTGLHELEGLRLIRSLRSQIVILDRNGLRAFAGDAYGAAEAEARRLTGWAGLPPDKTTHTETNQPD